MKKLTLIASVVLGLSTFFAADAAVAKSNEIAVIVKTENANFWQNVKKGAESAGKDLGGNYKISFQGPQAETAIDEEVNMVNNAINRGVAGIVLAASDPDALIPPVKRAFESGIPVVIIDSGINSDGKYYQSFLATDNRAAGKLAAEKLLAKHGTDKLVAVGFDGNADLQNFVRDGTLEGIVVQSSYQMGYKGVDTVNRILKGEKVEKFIDTGVVFVTKDNIDSEEAKAVLY